MSHLSVAMIVKNEEKNLRRCLESLNGIANEIIIVDTGSSDNTVAIASEFTSKIYFAEWTGNFAEARNIAIEQCMGDWILTLDADEALTHHDEVRKAMESDYEAIIFPIRNYFHDTSAILFDQQMVLNDGEYFPDFSHYAMFPGMRMFRNEPSFRYSGCIHEQILKDGDHKMNAAMTAAIIHHFGKCDLEREEKKKDQYLAMAKQQVEDEPENAQAWFNLMAQASVAQDPDLAIKAALVILALVKNPHIVVLSTLGMAYQAKEMHREALQYLCQALERQPDHALSMTRFPISLAILGNHEGAIEVCKHSISIYPDSYAAWIVYAECELYHGNNAEAKRILEEALLACPNEPIVKERYEQVKAMK